MSGGPKRSRFGPPQSGPPSHISPDQDARAAKARELAAKMSGQIFQNQGAPSGPPPQRGGHQGGYRGGSRGGYGSRGGFGDRGGRGGYRGRPRSQPGCKLYIGNLNYDIREPDLTSVFQPFGQLKDVKVVMDREDPSKSRGFAFVEFNSPQEANAALQANGTQLQGRSIAVRVAQEKVGGNDGRGRGGFRGGFRGRGDRGGRGRGFGSRGRGRGYGNDFNRNRDRDYNSRGGDFRDQHRRGGRGAYSNNIPSGPGWGAPPGTAWGAQQFRPGQNAPPAAQPTSGYPPQQPTTYGAPAAPASYPPAAATSYGTTGATSYPPQQYGASGTASFPPQPPAQAVPQYGAPQQAAPGYPPQQQYNPQTQAVYGQGPPGMAANPYGQPPVPPKQS